VTEFGETPFPGGYLNRGRIFRRDAVVVRRQLHPWPLAVEEALQELHRRDPVVFPGVVDRLSSNTVLLDYMPGIALPHDIPNWASSTSVLESAVAIGKHLSDVSFDIVRFIRDDDWLSKPIQPGECLVHGDLHPSNIVFDTAGEPISIIDFELARVGPPSWNLASLLFSWCPLEPQELTSWWQCQGISPCERADCILATWRYADSRAQILDILRDYIHWRRATFMRLASLGNTVAQGYVESSQYSTREQHSLSMIESILRK
jgi:serine/threonine protein kinase